MRSVCYERKESTGGPVSRILCGAPESTAFRGDYFRLPTMELLVSLIFFIKFESVSRNFDRRSIAICSRNDSVSLISLSESRFCCICC